MKNKTLTYTSPLIGPCTINSFFAEVGDPWNMLICRSAYFWLLGRENYRCKRRLEISTAGRAGSHKVYLKRWPLSYAAIRWGKTPHPVRHGLLTSLVQGLDASALAPLITAEPRAFYARLIK